MVELEPVVRRIEAGDGAALQRVRLAALRDTPSAFGSTYEAESVRAVEEWAERAAAGSWGAERATFFAEADGEIVGLVGGYRTCPSSSRVHLVSMWLAPTVRRRGVGRRLVTAVVGWASQTQASEVALWVTRGNVAAEELYRATGFVPTGEVRPLPSDPALDEVELSRPLRG